ncbi:MAG TPA: TonB family protein [Longimicrobium sp.]|nr:TonB family protein [Longimicrobium sp.]
MVFLLDALLVVVGGLLLVLSWWRAMQWKRDRAFWHGIAAAELATDEGEMPAVRRDFLRMVLAGERRGAFTEEAPRLRNARRVERVLAWRASAARIESAAEPVVIRMRVSRWGRPVEILVARSSGNPGFDEAAARAVRHARFAPARVFGRAVSVWVEVPLTIQPRR